MSDEIKMPPETGMTDEEIAELEKQRAEAEEARLAPYKRAKKQREDNAAIIAEHDEMLAEVLFEITMNQFGEEV